MSHCYSSQAEYDDHDFKDGICADCGQVDRPAVRELSKRLEEAEAKHLKAERKANDLFDEGIRQKKRAIAAEAKLAAVQEVHALEHCDKWGRRSETPQGLGGWCNSCGTFKGDACPTIAALDGTA